MSGIVACVRRSGEVETDRLAAAVAALRHRGPDGGGQWVATHRRAGLGQTRLGVGSGSAGGPVSAGGGRVRLVTGGQLVDDGEIAQRLAGLGVELPPGSPPEAALAELYLHEGARFLSRIRGELSLALWDEAAGVLLVARDRFGASPLFYSERAGTFWLASEAKALFAAGVPAALDDEALYQQLFVAMEDDRSLFRDVYQVPPGCYLLVGPRHTQLLRYWDLDYPVAGGESAEPEEELIEQLRDSLQEAVRLRMGPVGEVGYFLSGGVDSSTVVGMAARCSPEPIQVFTAVFNEQGAEERYDEGYDESAAARTTSDHCGATFHPTLITDRQLADELEDAIWAGELLGVNAHGVARYVHSRALREAGFHAALSGEGSDDFLGGFPSIKQDLLLEESRRRSGGGDQAGGGGLEALSGVAASLGFVPAWMQKVALSRSLFHLLLAPGFAAGLRARDPFRYFLDRCDVTGQLAGRRPVIQSIYLWSRAFLGGYVLCADRLSMAYSVAERLPFMDHRLFELVRRLPPSMLVRDGTEKWALRQAARPFLAPATYRRRKHSFSAPPAVVTPGTALNQRLQDTVRDEATRDQPVFDRDAMIDFLDRLPQLDESTRLALDPALMMLLCVLVIHRRYGM